MKSDKPKKSLLMRILKWTGLVLLLLLGLLIAAPFVFKGKIVAMVKEQANTNLNAKIDFGDFDLSIISSFPDFRFKVQKVSVIGVNDFAGDTLIWLGELRADINLKSVLSGGPYQINSIAMDKSYIHAIVLKDGRANWDIAKPSTDSTAALADTSATTFNLKLKEFRISDSKIIYDDRESNMYSLLEGFDYKLKGDFTQDLFTMSNLIEVAQTTYKMDGINYLNKAKTTFKADLEMDMLKSKYTFKENELRIKLVVLFFFNVAHVSIQRNICLNAPTHVIAFFKGHKIFH